MSHLKMRSSGIFWVNPAVLVKSEVFCHLTLWRAVGDVPKHHILLVPSGSSSPRRMSGLFSFEKPRKSRSIAQCHVSWHLSFDEKFFLVEANFRSDFSAIEVSSCGSG